MPHRRVTEVGQLKSVECTYADCQQRFDNEKQMKRHKKDDLEHHYCKKCDVDCLDYDDFVQHKVQAMQPWLEGSMIGNTEESPRHITCEFCGTDFKSFGGRRIHQEQMHQAQQHITCPGCQTIFTRGGEFVAHLEMGNCSHITRQQYVKNVQQKHVVSQIMQEPGRFMENVQASKAYADAATFPSLTSPSAASIIDSDTAEDDVGGVGLLDLDDGLLLDIEPLEFELPLIDLRTPKPSKSQAWPSLPYRPAGPQAEPSPSPAPSDSVSNIGGRGGGRAPTEPYPRLTSTSIPGSKDVVPVSKAPISAVSGQSSHPAAWSTGQTSRALFQDAPTTPPVAGDWAGHLDAREASPAPDRSNLLRHRFWDPTDENYDPDLFYRADMRQWVCPFAECDKFAVFDNRDDVEDHLRRAHVQKQYRCPLCLKVFDSASALVMHSEANGKCRVKKSPLYMKMIDELSGGFLNVRAVNQPRIFDPETALVQEGQIVHGVTANLFNAKLAD